MDSKPDVNLQSREEFNVLQELLDLKAPQPKYRQLLDTAEALCPMDGLAVVASRAGADQVLKDQALFSAEGLVNLGNVRPLIPLSIDPPRQTRYRKILDPLFAPKRMDAIEGDIADRFNRFVDEFVDRGECHFTDELAVPFPSAIFLGLMGLPWDELDTLLRFKAGNLRPRGAGAEPSKREEIQAATGQEIYAYFEAVLDERTKDPREDILTLFLNAEIEGERLTREEILDICFLFLIAGLDTVTDTLTC
jgi:cytochrome P450